MLLCLLPGEESCCLPVCEPWRHLRGRAVCLAGAGFRQICCLLSLMGPFPALFCVTSPPLSPCLPEPPFCSSLASCSPSDLFWKLFECNS